MKLLLASTSTVHGQKYLEYLKDDIKEFFKGVKTIVFIPYARPGGITWDEYTEVARKAFEPLGFDIRGVHEMDDAPEAIKRAEGVFTGGGNTFVLLNTLYEKGLIPQLRDRILSGMPYMGSSAGTNIAGAGIETTNDMPVLHPPSFEALHVVPFNINPHYLDPDPGSKHMGETRETRIKEFLVFNNRKVVGLREGSHLWIEGGNVELRGTLPTRIFSRDGIKEYPPGEKLNFLLETD